MPLVRFLSLANPEDEFFLLDFNATARVSVPFTADAGEITESASVYTSGRADRAPGRRHPGDRFREVRTEPAPGFADHLRRRR
jgi:hypothetical protein